MTVRRINIKHGLGLGGLLKLLNRVTGNGFLRQGEELRRHDAAGRSLGVRHQIGHLLRLFGFHQRQNILRQVLGQDAQNIRGVISRHGP